MAASFYRRLRAAWQAEVCRWLTVAEELPRGWHADGRRATRDGG